MTNPVITYGAFQNSLNLNSTSSFFSHNLGLSYADWPPLLLVLGK